VLPSASGSSSQRQHQATSPVQPNWLGWCEQVSVFSRCAGIQTAMCASRQRLYDSVLDNVSLVSSILSFTGKGHFLLTVLVSKKWAEAYRLVSDKTSYAAALESELRLLEAREHGFVDQDLLRPAVAYAARGMFHWRC
jgi:hypothetical protein